MSSLKHILTISYQQKIVSTISIVEYKKDLITVGRSNDNDIVISSPIVSQHHAVIEIRGNICLIKDKNSTNGLIVNHNKQTSYELKNGDNIRIDDVNNPHSEGILIVYSVIESDSDERWAEYNLLLNDEIIIGRGSENHIVLSHSTISRQHAKIIKKGDNYIIEDLKSTNGTYINGKLVTGQKVLMENDVIFIGNTKLIFQNGRIVYNIISKGLRLDAININKVIKERRDLFKQREYKQLLDNISIGIKSGELIALVGGSGAGKSTFMDALNGFRRATGGTVLVNDDNFYENYNAYKNILGYVPQQDIVYDLLNVVQMLTYASELRMPKDTTKTEISERVKQVIKDVELNGKEEVVIKNLSGGQKKRVSIAVELLADPMLFFLDEPTSGLDPGMERNMMQLLKKLSNMGKTIILITHAMANLHLCDKVVFLGKGGKLCYFGPPEGALEFFGVKDHADIYNLISEESENWEVRFKNSNYYIYHKTLENKTAQKSDFKKVNSHSSLRQFIILSKRYLKLTLLDKQRCMFLLIQSPLIAVLLGIVSKKNSFDTFENTNQIIFTLACAAVWIGVLNSIQEICKERTIFKRERAVNLEILPYMASKLVILGIICIIQAVLLVQIFNLVIPYPKGFSLIGSLQIEIMVSVFLTLFASTAMGLCVSTLVSNNDRAMGIAPILLIPQIMFSGFIFKLSGFADKLSYIIVSKWSLRALGVSFKINELPTRIIEENKNKPQIVEAFKQIGRELEQAYDHDINGLYTNWGILLLIVFVCVIFSSILLYRKSDKY